MTFFAYPITALAESDAVGTDGKNIVASAVVTATDLNLNTVLMYDDDAGTNPETAKALDLKGEGNIYFTPGEYLVKVNSGTAKRINVGGQPQFNALTTAELQASRPVRDGQVATNQQRANAKYVLSTTAAAQPGDVEAANGNVWVLQLTGYAWDSRWFGVVSNGSTDDYAALALAVSRVPNATENAYTILLPSGQTMLGTELAITNKNIAFVGTGYNSSVIRPTNAGMVNCISIDGNGVSLSSFSMSGIGIRQLGVMPTTTLLKITNVQDTQLSDVKFICSGGLINIGVGCTFNQWSNVRGEAYGGLPAVLFESGSYTGSNVYIRKANSYDNNGPTFWIRPNPIVTTFRMGDSELGGAGAAYKHEISSISSTATDFTVTISDTHTFIDPDVIVIRGTTNYDGTWEIDSYTSSTVTISSDVNHGSESPSGAYLESVNACLLISNENGTAGESGFNNVIFEGVDTGGTAATIGTASVYLDGNRSVSALFNLGFGDCYMDVGQTGFMCIGRDSGGSSSTIYGADVKDCDINGVKAGIYLSSVSGVKVSDNSIFRPNGVNGTDFPLTETDNSAAVILRGYNLLASKGLWFTGNNMGRQPDWRADATTVNRSYDYGLRVDGFPQDLHFEENHIFGYVAPIDIDQNPTTSVAPYWSQNTRMTVGKNSFASTSSAETASTVVPSYASASTVIVGMEDKLIITGSTNVADIVSKWIGRELTVICSDGTTFSGSGFYGTTTLAAGEATKFIYDGTSWANLV